ncbi:photosystem I reaction center subunit XI [Scytonema sp. UIC 10036]|uniref:photosystem I reaction center subunit XI n=1 Tax=Scytonema sp. UIC 10036 TaxID=2304196 RepID=UPI001FAAE0CF|nr:photosystem I reaction center subunit XI [Scytonema sp. UIC 10036]
MQKFLNVAYMAFLAAYFISVNNTVYPEVFYGPLKMWEASAGNVSPRGWLAVFHFVFGVLFLFGHIWHAIHARAVEAGFDFQNGDMIQPAGHPEDGNLATPINSSDLTLNFLKNLPIYRPGLSSLSRGLEIGMAHGYWLIGPFAKLGPLRDSEAANLIGLLAASGLIVILTIGLSIYGTASYQNQTQTVPQFTSGNTVPPVPEALQTTQGWSQFTAGFLIGGIGGAIFAYLALNSLDVLAAIR